jgi:membrane peptidoglycan carboxypeptidase
MAVHRLSPSALRRLGGGLALLPAATLAFAAGTLVALPTVADAPRIAQALMRMHGEGIAMPVPYRLARAVIAIEDEHFEENVVLNVLTGVGRAAVAVVEGQTNPGGATIDQQLAKALYGQRAGVLGVLRQIALGVKLGLGYSHREILAMYLNVNYLGHGFWGVRQAAQGYFHTAPGDLSWAQAALLAGLLQAPSAYDPLLHPALARARRAEVLAQLATNHDLTAAQAAAAGRAALTRR